MIQINDNSNKVVINFPRNNRNFQPTLLKVKSVLLNIENSYSIDAEVQGDYFTFEIDLSDLKDGEYKALITDGNQDNNTYDIIRIGEIKSNSKSINNKITYKAYGK